jgi:hypothetical protein
VANVGSAIEHIYPLVYPYRMEDQEDSPVRGQAPVAVHQYAAPGKIPRQRAISQPYKRARLDVSSEEDSEDYEDYNSEEEDY